MIKNFCDLNGKTIELGGSHEISKAEFTARFPGVDGIPYKGRQHRIYLIASPVGTFRMEDMVPVTRRIEYKSQPSLHKCNAKCIGGRCDGACECRCGGVNHGIGNFRN